MIELAQHEKSGEWYLLQVREDDSGQCITGIHGPIYDGDIKASDNDPQLDDIPINGGFLRRDWATRWIWEFAEDDIEWASDQPWRVIAQHKEE